MGEAARINYTIGETILAALQMEKDALAKFDTDNAKCMKK